MAQLSSSLSFFGIFILIYSLLYCIYHLHIRLIIVSPPFLSRLANTYPPLRTIYMWVRLVTTLDASIPFSGLALQTCEAVTPGMTARDTHEEIADMYEEMYEVATGRRGHEI